MRPEGHQAPHLTHVDRKARRRLDHAAAAGLDELHVQAVPTSEFDSSLVLQPKADRVVHRLLRPAHPTIISMRTDTTDTPPTA
jgi:hypothetical protein